MASTKTCKVGALALIFVVAFPFITQALDYPSDPDSALTNDERFPPEKISSAANGEGYNDDSDKSKLQPLMIVKRNLGVDDDDAVGVAPGSQSGDGQNQGGKRKKTKAEKKAKKRTKKLRKKDKKRRKKGKTNQVAPVENHE